MYCLTKVAKVTDDHVFAKSWYPSTTPKNLERWKVPACSNCNNKFSRVEEVVLHRLAMCVDDSHPAAEGILEKALRSIDARLGTNGTDETARRKKREKLMREIIHLEKLPEIGLLPFSAANWDCGPRVAVPIPAGEMDDLVRKWVRGVHFKTMDRLISFGTAIHVRYVDEEKEDVKEALRRFEGVSSKYFLGPGIKISQAVIQDTDELLAVYGFSFWNQFTVYSHFKESILAGEFASP